MEKEEQAGDESAPAAAAETDQQPVDEQEESAVVKHPLQNNWRLWYWKHMPGHDWKTSLLKVAKFNTVEDFWALYNHIESASNLLSGSDYCLFKDDIEPMWEDNANRKGGRWLFTLLKQPGTKYNVTIDDLWTEVLLCLIGEAFGEYSTHINGAVLNIRPKMDKVAVWTTDFKDRKAVMHIGEVLKQRTGFSGTIAYESHQDTAQKQSSTAKAMYTV